jgi:hypothetical protein
MLILGGVLSRRFKGSAGRPAYPVKYVWSEPGRERSIKDSETFQTFFPEESHF